MATKTLHPKDFAVSLHERESILRRISSNAVRIMLTKKLQPIQKNEFAGGVYRGSPDSSVTACVMQQPISEDKLIFADTANSDEITDLFGLQLSRKVYAYQPTPEETSDPPAHTIRNIYDFAEAGYDNDDERSRRLLVEYLLIPAVVAVREEATSCKSLELKRRVFRHYLSRTVLKMYHGLQLRDQLVKHPRTGIEYRVMGKADWVASYEDKARASDKPLLLGVVAKNGLDLGRAQTQLLCCMAMIRHLHKEKIGLRGFATDGYVYCIYQLEHDGVIKTSTPLVIRRSETCSTETDKLATVYSFLVNHLRLILPYSRVATEVKGLEDYRMVESIDMAAERRRQPPWIVRE